MFALLCCGLSCLASSCRINVTPFLCIFTEPSPSFKDCKSLHLRNVVIAIRNTVFNVVYFSVAIFIGSKGGRFSISKTRGKFHSGTSLRIGGRELKTPFNNLMIFGCCPTGLPLMGANTDDSIDR